MENAIEQVEYKGYRISLYQDSDSENPRSWDNLGTMLCWHRNYSIGDEKPAHLSDPEDALTWAQDAAKNGEIVMLMIRGYDHGRLSIRAYGSGVAPDYPFNDYWDSGWLGFIYATRERILDEFSAKRMTPALKTKVAGILAAEVDTFNAWGNNNVVGYVIETVDETRPALDDSCWGYYPQDGSFEYVIAECKANIDYHLEHNYSQLRLPA